MTQEVNLKEGHAVTQELVPVAHEWQPQYFKDINKPVRCHTCTGAVWWNFIWNIKKPICNRCTICGYIVHLECADSVEFPCRQEHSTSTSAEVPHQWIHDNVSYSIKKPRCSGCDASIRGHKTSNPRCTYCHRTYCKKCFVGVENSPCDGGDLARMRVPAVYASPEKLHLLLTADSQDDIRPVIVFTNKRSGGGKGELILQKMKQLLGKIQVFDLGEDGGPAKGLQMYTGKPVLAIAAGGDGTVKWLLSVVHQMGLDNVTVGVIPLGTGNDMSRALGWGGSYADGIVEATLDGLKDCIEVELDQWILKPTEGEGGKIYEGGKLVDSAVMCNYFSYGIDAKIAGGFHEAREAKPKKYNSRRANLSKYGQLTAKAMVDPQYKDLSSKVTINVMNENYEYETVEQGESTQAVILSNIPSYGAGMEVWKDKEQPQFINDELLELVTVDGAMHLTGMKMGTRSACTGVQGKGYKFIVNTDEQIHAQIDGEPYILEGPGSFELVYGGQATMVARNDENVLKYYLN